MFTDPSGIILSSAFLMIETKIPTHVQFLRMPLRQGVVQYSKYNGEQLLKTVHVTNSKIVSQNLFVF